MKLTLIMPGVGRKPGQPYVASWKMEPLSFAVLAALTPPEIDVRFFDDRLEALPYDSATDAVALNVEAYTARRAYAIAGEFRRRGVPVILGGYHPTLMPEEAMQYANAIVEGAAEPVWGRVLEDLKAGQLQTRYRGGGGAAGALAASVRPRRDIFAGKKYTPVTLVEAGRGCKFTCDFCSITQFYRRTAMARSADEVLAEIQAAGGRNVFFVDDNIVADRDRAKQLCRALQPARIRWFSQGSLTMADDPELLALMRASGCAGVLIGFESLSPATLAAMGKSWNRAARDYGESIRRIRDAGIPIYATFVFGYDTDDADALDRTVEFAIGQRFFLAAFNHLVPFPGTPLYARLKEEGRLRCDPWWLAPDYRFGDLAFHPRSMSAEELSRRCFEARQTFYRFGSVCRRAWDFRCNLRTPHTAATYFWLNAFSAREARQRQGLPLGAGFDDLLPPAPLAEARPLQEAAT